MLIEVFYGFINYVKNFHLYKIEIGVISIESGDLHKCNCLHLLYMERTTTDAVHKSIIRV